MRDFFLRLVPLLLSTVLLALPAKAQDAPATTGDGGAANRQAIVNAIGQRLLERQVGSRVPATEIEAQEVDLNFDRLPEIYVYRKVPDCDGVACGNFFFALLGDGFRDVLAEIPGARLWPEDSISLGIYKRQRYIDLQVGDATYGWAGDHYAEAAGFPSSTLNGDAYVAACKADAEEGNPDAAAGEADANCACRMKRFEALNLTQNEVDRMTRTILRTGTEEDKAFDATATADWWNLGSDVAQGCGVEAGTTTWPSAFFTEDLPPQPALERLPEFVEACSAQPWVVSAKKVGTPDRALAFCGCLAREIPVGGASQEQADDLTRYFRDEIGDAELDEADANTLVIQDTASETCLTALPPRS